MRRRHIARPDNQITTGPAPDANAVAIVRPDAPRDVVSQQGPLPRSSRHVFVNAEADRRDIGLLNWLIAHCEFAAGGGYGPDGVAHLWSERAAHLREILRRKYGYSKGLTLSVLPHSEAQHGE